MNKYLSIILALALARAGALPALADSTAVAGAGEMATPQEVGYEDMTPVSADMLVDGEYELTVDSSSTMFNIVACTLTVSEGQMTARMTMGGTGYLYVCMATGEEAAAADESSYIPFEEGEGGEHSFTVPVEALNAALPCAAFSKSKEKWYDRTLVFRADSLPIEAIKDEYKVTPATLGLADGSYTVEVALSGGLGRASVESPTALRIEDGIAWAVITFGSPNYDYMIVGDEKYLCINEEGNSSFEIPVAAFDLRLGVKADTVAMSQPHEIDYALLFDSATIQAAQ